MECPKKCKDAIPQYSEQKVERKAPGTNTVKLLCLFGVQKVVLFLVAL